MFTSIGFNSESFTGDLYANHLVRSIVHKIATYCSLVSFQHVKGKDKTFRIMDKSNINRLLTIKPNSLLMTPSEVWYKFFTDLWVRNNSYIWIKRDTDGTVLELIPIICSGVTILEKSGFLFYKFTLNKGNTVIVRYEDVIHCKRYYYKDDFFGENNEPVRESIGLVNTMTESLSASLKNGAHIKGILQHQNTVDPEDLKRHEKLFKESYLSAKNSGGIGMIDQKFNFIPVSWSGKITDAAQMKEIRDYVYRYFHFNDELLMSNYNSDVWQAFHDGEIAPVLNYVEQSMNIRLFTDKELGFDNRIKSSINHISFMSASQRINMVKLALDGAVYNRNEIRGWFGDAPIPGGDTYQYSKNFTEETSSNKGGNSDGQNKTTETNTTDDLSQATETT